MYVSRHDLLIGCYLAMKSQAFIFIGRSGSGKGTQVELLKPFLEKTGLPVLYIETGDMFRKFIKGDSYSSKLSKVVYESDSRQPDFLASYMWATFLVRDFTGQSHIIIDGAPRSENEARLLETALKFYCFEKAHIINLEVSRSWSEKHLLARGRSDDANLAKIDLRLNWFDSDVIPAIEYFKGTDHNVVTVNGEQTVEEVHADILKALSPYL